jgi:hypothetical protein
MQHRQFDLPAWWFQPRLYSTPTVRTAKPDLPIYTTQHGSDFETGDLGNLGHDASAG